jgi:hypothetical protein
MHCLVSICGLDVNPNHCLSQEPLFLSCGSRTQRHNPARKASDPDCQRQVGKNVNFLQWTHKSPPHSCINFWPMGSHYSVTISQTPIKCVPRPKGKEGEQELEDKSHESSSELSAFMTTPGLRWQSWPHRIHQLRPHHTAASSFTGLSWLWVWPAFPLLFASSIQRTSHKKTGRGRGHFLSICLVPFAAEPFAPIVFTPSKWY